MSISIDQSGLTRRQRLQRSRESERSASAGRMDRRTVLRASGLSLGLPLLEAMTPAGRSAYASSELALTATGESVPPVRMACVFVPNGVIGSSWEPKVHDNDWELSETLQPLAALKQKLNVIGQLEHENGTSGRDGAGDHARGGSTFLTAARPVKTSSNIRVGVSVDQVAATALQGKTRLPSIELGLNGSRNAGSCDSGYSCAYSSNISWKNESQPMPKETIPRLAFERMFGSGNAAAERKQRLARQSILDVVRGDVQRLMNQVGTTDKRKLDEYLNSVREIEQRIHLTESADRAALPDLEVPYGRVSAFREHARLMYDLMAIGFQTDTTRVATMMLDTAGGNRSYTEIDIKDAHHGLSHHRDKPESVEKLKKIDHYLVEQHAYFLERLDSIAEGEGTLLDHSMVLYGSGLGDGNRHTHKDLPIVLAGGAGGQIETGRYIRHDDQQPMANLFLTMLDKMGTPADSIGDSSGRLTSLA